MVDRKQEEAPKGDAYTMEFIGRKGGPEDVARKTGINRQTVRQVSIGRNAPSFEFIMKMLSSYPDYDIRNSIARPQQTMAIAGHEDENFDDLPDPVETSVQPNSAALQVLSIENNSLKREIKRLEQTVNFLQNVVSAQMGKDLGSGSKIESAGNATEGLQLTLGQQFMTRRSVSPMFLDIRDAHPMNLPGVRRNQ